MNPGSLPVGNRSRRMAIKNVFGLMLGSAVMPQFARANRRPFRIGLTPAFVHDEYGLMEEWRRYLEVKLDRPVEFIQRDSYRETMDLLHQEKLDFAWLCDYPFVYLKDTVRLLAVPLNQGRPTYRSYLIVSADDTTHNTLLDLKGAVFAYSDPFSNTGYLVPRYQLKTLGQDPKTFFRKTFFTWSHRKAIAAVAAGLARGAAIDSFVWDTLARFKPGITAKTRIIDQSPEFGFPPFVAQRSVSATDFNFMQATLLGMENDAIGKPMLDRLNISGFVLGERSMYDEVTKMMRAFGEI